MRQNAVSRAPQNEAPTQRLATRAMMPAVVEDSRTWRSASLSVLAAVEGNSSCRSARTERSSDWLASTCPATNSAISATGKTDSSRLYATIAARPVRLSEYAFSQNWWTPEPIRRMATAWRAGEPLWRRGRWVPFRANANPPSKERLTTMARLTFRRLLLVGVAVGAAAAYAKRE